MRRLLVLTIVALSCFAFPHAVAARDREGRRPEIPRRAVLAAVASSTQDAQGDQNQNGQGQQTSRSVPEFDPLTIGAIAVVLAAGGVLIARRRRS